MQRPSAAADIGLVMARLTLFRKACALGKLLNGPSAPGG